ncbi:pyridoxal 5'-phosphate synthase [Kitasatospora sp. NPDC096147]|uniref:pyridoxine/pyridoxamine 5'-phosphate oxidase n=1 Tax=Kitasatospora sp. NPDC096147 TaxID=3364093 RepID=UPI0037FD4016
METEHDAGREWLRGLAVFAGRLPGFDPASAPADPVRLFTAWLTEAVAEGVREPHAMTLSTVDAEGAPDARVLILKGVDTSGWQFATHALSPKGGQLTARPQAALTFYWPDLGRQVRVRGAVAPGTAEESAADFLARSPAARAEALTGRQSRRVDGPEAGPDDALAEAVARIEREPSLVDPAWTRYTLAATRVEFWQASPDRSHVRLRYDRDGGRWERYRVRA